MPIPDTAPDEIVASADVYARRVGKDYLTSLPYHPDAVSRIRMIAGATYERSNGWVVPVRRSAILTEVLQEVAKLCEAEGLRLPASRRLALPESDDVSPSP